MEAVIVLMFFFGAVLALAGQLMLWVVIYHTDPGWFFACLVVPLVCLLFWFLYPRRTWKAGVVWLAGLLLLGAGYILWQYAQNFTTKPSFTMPPA